MLLLFFGQGAGDGGGIDTAAKRLSALDFCMSPYGAALPSPDGSFGMGDLYHLLGLYSGISEGEEEVGEVSEWIIRYRRRGRR